jgi:hypothetical protein
MKKLYILLILLPLSARLMAQCTPVNCISTLPAYGGICDSVLDVGRVGVPYSDVVSFHVTNACVDAGILDPGSAGIGIRITSIHSFTFNDFPGGIGGVTNQPTYTPTANGCAAITGIPTEAGVFIATVSFLVNVNAWLFSASCGGIFPPVPQNDNPLSGDVEITILPDPTFAGLDTVYCENMPDVTLTPTGTQGGTFSGPGVTGNVFSPATAGPGVHVVKYVVTAQEGTAFAPATDSSEVTVTVMAAVNLFYADGDGDGFGDPMVFVMDCYAPAGYVADSTDCDDTNNAIYPGAPEIPDNGIDEDCDGFDLTTGLAVVAGNGLYAYPNPGSNHLVTNATAVEVYNLLGMKVAGLTPGKNGVTNTQNLPSDIYILLLKTPYNAAYIRWVKW